ncbi:MAG: hypothetical protein PUP93_09700, partial [Rhizonema sp. NSF051]|nr:hypothetical protein [Rhizonema sp. NSF051]
FFRLIICHILVKFPLDLLSSNSGLFSRVRGVGDATANGGNINVTARSIRLDKQGTISTETMLGNGGNITLNVRDILQLRNKSSITASAGTAGAVGNGGNITINTPNGFIVGVPGENSDITANSFSDSGGKIDIKANGIFFLTPLSRQELERERVSSTF